MLLPGAQLCPNYIMPSSNFVPFREPYIDNSSVVLFSFNLHLNDGYYYLSGVRNSHSIAFKSFSWINLNNSILFPRIPHS